MNYTIEHIDDIHILYNNQGKHDKIYIVLVCRSDEWPEQWYVKGLYRPRTRAKYNLSEITQRSVKESAKHAALAIVDEKIRKGYRVVADDNSNTHLGFPATKSALALDLQNLISGVMKSPDVKLDEYECVDDLGMPGQFIPGMRYMGKLDASGVLHMFNDNNKSVIIPLKDNFQKV